jgi:FkbM family methyltransferase
MRLTEKIINNAKIFIKGLIRIPSEYRLTIDRKPLLLHPVETAFGFKFAGNRNMELGTHEVQEVKIVKECLRDTDIFINVGANIGYYCCLALKNDKHTIAFEPIDANLKNLYINITANQWDDDIEIFPIALSNKTGLADIYGSGTGASLIKGWAGTPIHQRQPVPVSTLDKILGNRFEGQKIFILMDAEGVEKSILEGSQRHLAMNPKPIWMIEISLTEHQPYGVKINPHFLDTFRIMWKHGYEVWTADERLQHITEYELIRLTESGENTLQTHNFLFMGANDAAKIIPNHKI